MPYIQSGSYNAKTKKIEINVRYSGGCAKHKFRLKVDTCRESYPVQCDATLIDLTTGDFCKALIHRKISISLHEAGLDNNYYKGASIRIRGAEQKLGDSAYIIRGTDREKPAWHYILVPLSKLADIKAQGTGSDINVTDFGCIIAYLDNSGNIQKTSDWGFDPPEMVQALIETNYDLASVDETISLNYEEDDIRLCTMQRAISEQKLGFFSCYHRKERFHYVKFYGDWKSRSEFTLPRQLICDVFSNKFPSLRYVNMSCIDESTYNLWTTSPSLQYVSILSCKLMSIPSILAACPNLHHLQVRLLYNNDNIITLSSPVNHSLRRLTLWSNYTELTFNDIDNILTYTPNLEHLYLQTVYHMPFIHLANGLINRLHHLSRFDCYIREILPRDDPIGNLTSMHQMHPCFDRIKCNPNERTVAVDSTYMNDENRTILKLQLSLLGLTDDLHPFPIDHDYTLQTNAGHYVFYNPKNIRSFGTAEISTRTLLQPSTDRTQCDGKELIRIPASITGKDPPINDWTLVNVILPNEKIQVSIQLNFTEGLIAFNDIAVDYCDRPRPLPSKSLPQYPYEWSILKASNTIQIEHEASSVDYTFGKVGYRHLQKEFQFTSQESYCLNSQVYSYGTASFGDLMNVQRSFALDNIAINLCDDPPTELTMCDMINKHDDSSSMFNFTVVTGNREFGSTRDHTSTSSSGSFLY
ncbi:unnamed protein product [Rotaria sp. Silwood1]|nr:unnamed protein product [Rotaria sp. Silwood1]